MSYFKRYNQKQILLPSPNQPIYNIDIVDQVSVDILLLVSMIYWLVGIQNLCISISPPILIIIRIILSQPQPHNPLSFYTWTLFSNSTEGNSQAKIIKVVNFM